MSTPTIIDLPSVHHSSRNGAPVRALVAHATAGADSRSWLAQNSRQVSAHDLIQKTGIIYRMVPEGSTANHAGFSQIRFPDRHYSGSTRPTINQITLGIELENLNNGRDPYPDAQLAAFGWRARDYMSRFGLLPIIRHGDIDTQGKTDPADLTYERLYLLTNPRDLTWLASPRISRDVFSGFLAARRSPAAPHADACYAALTAARFDPGLALGIYDHESKCGTLGAARTTNSWGNNRRGRGRETHVAVVPGSSGQFAHYRTVLDALLDWIEHISKGYLGGDVFGGIPMPTLCAALPIYAPSSDGNAPRSYANAVIANVERWQAQSQGIADPWAAWGAAFPLDSAQRTWAIPQRWLHERDLGGALSGELYRPDGGASVQYFEGGVILWWRADDRTEVVR